MTNEPEQIGELVYQPNADYPYPFPVEHPPHFWMTEQTGALSEAVELYFGGEKLPAKELDLIKQYLRQFVERAVLPGDAKRAMLLQKIDTLRTTNQIEEYADELSEYGVEAF